jgi:hypothetical protein
VSGGRLFHAWPEQVAKPAKDARARIVEMVTFEMVTVEAVTVRPDIVEAVIVEAVCGIAPGTVRLEPARFAMTQAIAAQFPLNIVKDGLADVAASVKKLRR